MNTKTAYMGLLLAFALILSYIESLLPFSFGIPGIKLGLSNLAVLLGICLIGYRQALLLAISKAVICGFLFGNLSMMIYSLAGALFSFAIMAVMTKSGWFHLPVISMAGGVMHNMGQVLTAYLAIKTYGLVYYVPILILAGVITGTLNGIAASLVMPYLKKIIGREENL